MKNKSLEPEKGRNVEMPTREQLNQTKLVR